MVYPSKRVAAPAGVPGIPIRMDEMVESLNMKLRQRFDYFPGRKRAAARGPRIRNFIVPAAASIIILVSIISYFHFLVPETNELALMDKKETQVHKQENDATIGGVFNREAEEKEVPATSRALEKDEPAREEIMVSIQEEKATEQEEIALVEEEIILAEPGEDIAADEEKESADETISAYAMEELAGEGITYEDDMAVSRAKSGKRAAAETNEILVVYDQSPSFPGGEDSLYVFLARYMKYNVVPEQAADTSILVQFIVTRKGRSKDFNIIQGAGEDVNKEILRVLNMMPNWIPAIKEGKNVEESVSLPINLKLK
jgi:hypothetical protein